MKRKNWTREELILAINLYCKTPFGKIHIRNPEIIALAKYLDRTPGSVSYKLANFASIDPSLNRKGASHSSKLDRQVWNEFFMNWEAMSFESEIKLSNTNIDYASFEIDIPIGKDRESISKTRINQSFFRKTILASYKKCCITGIEIPELLVASHIVPWSVDKKNRTNPSNGLCLNALHDKAFDRGLISIDEEYKVILSKKILAKKSESNYLLFNYIDQRILLPERFLPDQIFLAYHRENIFSS